MTRKELIERVNELDFIETKKNATIVLDLILENIINEVQNGNEVALGQKFGTFKPITRAARTGVNPSTGAKLDIPAKKAIKFQASAALKRAIEG